MAAADLDLLIQLLVALGVGGVVGIEREHRGDRARVIAGVRTFPLVAISGVLAVRLAQELGGSPWPVIVGAIVAGAFSMGMFWARHQMGETGLTTPAAMFVTYLAGALIGFGMAIEGLVVGVATAALLVSKRRLHGIAHHLTDDEVMSAVQFITVAFILFPLTANIREALDPWGLVGPGGPLNPYGVLLIVVFVSSISFASFLAMRTVGAKRGVEVSGLLGGLVNSEATTASLAAHAHDSEALERVALVGALLATATMFVRNLAIAAFVDPTLRVAQFMALPLFAMALATGAFAWQRERKLPAHHASPTVTIGNPFALGPAFKFALLFVLVSLLAYGAQQSLGPWGVYATVLGAFVSGGAVVASVGALALGGQVAVLDAGIVAVLACVIGAFNKLLILRATHRGMYERGARAFTVVGVVGILALAAVLAWWML